MNQCNNPQDLIGEDIVYDESLVIIMFDDNNSVFNCYTREEFEMMIDTQYNSNSRLVIWTDRGLRKEDEFLFIEPYTNQYIDNSILKYRNSNAFFVYLKGEFRIGTQSGDGRVHGSMSKVWTVVPIDINRVLSGDVIDYKRELHIAYVELFKAVRDNDIETCKALITPENANSKVDGSTLLYTAYGKQHFEICKLLIENGANTETLLIMVSSNGHLELCKLLLEYGADVNMKNNRGETSLFMASFNGHLEICRLLIEKGADVNMQNNRGVSPLNMSSFNGHLEICRLLLENGANVNVENSGLSPLFMASHNGHLEICRLLLENGANVNAINNGKTAHEIASFKGYNEIRKLLIDYGATI